MSKSFIFFALLLISSLLQAAENEISVVYDPNPERGIPPEAMVTNSKDGKNYGPFKTIVNPDDVQLIKVRYYDNSFKNIQELQNHLNSILHSEKGSTLKYIPWAEGLPIPSVEATIYFKSGWKGKWLLWPNRSAFQDKQLQWWFGYGF
jgi:hypothetical protein